MYQVRKLNEKDVDLIYELCSSNPQFYEYHPPFVTRESILKDMKALPPGKDYTDKYFVGFWDGELLIAIMDLILGYPRDKTAYIGLFMVDGGCQGRGVGRGIIEEAAVQLAAEGFTCIRLAIDEGNPQSEAFWSKNGFSRTGEACPGETSIYIPMEREF